MRAHLQNNNNYRSVLAAVKENGNALRYASPDLKNSSDIVLAAVKQAKKALIYAGSTLTQNKQFILEVMKVNGLALKYVVKKLKVDQEIVTAALAQNSLAIKYLPPQFMKDKNFLLKALSQGDRSEKVLKYLNKDLRDDQDIILAAMRGSKFISTFNWPQIILEISRKNWQDKQFCLRACKDNPFWFCLIHHSLSHDKSFIFSLVDHAPHVIPFVMKFFEEKVFDVKNDDDLILKLINRTPFILFEFDILWHRTDMIVAFMKSLLNYDKPDFTVSILRRLLEAYLSGNVQINNKISAYFDDQFNIDKMAELSGSVNNQLEMEKATAKGIGYLYSKLKAKDAAYNITANELLRALAYRLNVQINDDDLNALDSFVKYRTLVYYFKYYSFKQSYGFRQARDHGHFDEVILAAVANNEKALSYVNFDKVKLSFLLKVIECNPSVLLSFMNVISGVFNQQSNGLCHEINCLIKNNISFMRKFTKLLPQLPIDFVKNIQLRSLFTEQELNDCQSSVNGISGCVFFNILSFLDARYVYKVKQTFFSEKQWALCLVDEKGTNLQQIGGSLQNDYDVCVNAVKQSAEAIQHVSHQHDRYIDIALEAVSQNAASMLYVKKDTQL
ncbi:MAG: DUF4116 domain-containing protein, partial [Candidatus Comchoanobacterales bacterium]